MSCPIELKRTRPPRPPGLPPDQMLGQAPRRRGTRERRRRRDDTGATRCRAPRGKPIMSWTSLCELGELEEGQGKYVEIGGFQLAVFKQGEQVYVIDNYCPHAGGNLAGGFVEDGCAVCPWH